MNHTKNPAIVAIIVVAAIGVLLVATATQAFAAVNLNSSKSNVFGVQQEQSVNAETINEPVTQTNTISCDCSQSDSTTINNNNSEDNNNNNEG
jgi:hypothetical protein